MSENFLLQSQKNEILFLIKKAGLDPAYFEWSQVESENFSGSKISKLNYINTTFFYAFDMNGETHYAFYAPAENSYMGTDYPVVWKKQKKCFRNWLNNLIKEETEPDLWENISRPSGPDNTQAYSAKPSVQSPDYDTMSVKLEKLLEKNINRENYAGTKSGFVIKRYYGKA